MSVESVSKSLELSEYQSSAEVVVQNATIRLFTHKTHAGRFEMTIEYPDGKVKKIDQLEGSFIEKEIKKRLQKNFSNDGEKMIEEFSKSFSENSPEMTALCLANIYSRRNGQMIEFKEISENLQKFCDPKTVSRDNVQDEEDYFSIILNPEEVHIDVEDVLLMHLEFKKGKPESILFSVGAG